MFFIGHHSTGIAPRLLNRGGVVRGLGARGIHVRRDNAFRAIVAHRLDAESHVVNRDILQRVGVHLADVDFLFPIARR